MSRLLIIVPETLGVNTLADLPGIETMLIAPDAPIPDAARDAEILVVGPAEQQSEVDATLRQIERLPNLKQLLTLGQGVEQWDGLLPMGLEIVTARGAHGGSTAELAVALLLSLVRRLPRYHDDQRTHEWHGETARTLLNMNVLIYGTGDLGSNVRCRLEPFGARITMVADHARDEIIDTETAGDRLPRTDAVVLALPLTPDTHHIADAQFLSRLPDGAIVINTGRGGLVDQDALLKELRSGRLQAGLDVMTPEPLPRDDPLWDAPNLLITPHVGGNTDRAGERAWGMLRQRIIEYRAHADDHAEE